MIISLLWKSPILFFTLVPVLLFAFTVHEFSHAFAAYKLGDKSQKYKNRMSLNPKDHIDPIGLLMLFVVGFGWAKPVEVNPMAFKDRKLGMKLVAAAGPLSNLVMAFLFTIAFALVARFRPDVNLDILIPFLSFGVQINLWLMVFNLIPIPPLDGSKMFLPDRMLYKLYENMQVIRIVFLVMIFTGFLSETIIGPVSGVLLKILEIIANAIVGVF